MEEVAFLTIMALMFVLASIASIIFGKLKMPAIIGYLAAGMIIANFWGAPEGDSMFLIKILSDVGLVLLMFGIGMELNMKKMKQSGAFTILVAAVQLTLLWFYAVIWQDIFSAGTLFSRSSSVRSYPDLPPRSLPRYSGAITKFPKIPPTRSSWSRSWRTSDRS